MARLDARKPQQPYASFSQELQDASVCMLRLQEVFELPQALAAVTASQEDAAGRDFHVRKKAC
jgi:hypothetical protein